MDDNDDLHQFLENVYDLQITYGKDYIKLLDIAKELKIFGTIDNIDERIEEIKKLYEWVDKFKSQLLFETKQPKDIFLVIKDHIQEISEFVKEEGLIFNEKNKTLLIKERRSTKKNISRNSILSRIVKEIYNADLKKIKDILKKDKKEKEYYNSEVLRYIKDKLSVVLSTDDVSIAQIKKIIDNRQRIKTKRLRKPKLKK